MSEPTQTSYSGQVFDISAAQADNLDERGVPKKLGRLFRRGQASYDKDSGTVTMAVSSSNPVDRYFGREILSHDKGAIRTDRLKQGIALLFNHEYDQHLGRSVSYQMGDPLHVTCRFGGNPLAKEKEGDVESGILVDVSIGYIVHEWEITEDKTGNRDYLAVDWELLEVSLVTVPADPTVGVGRGVDEEDVKVRSFRKFDDEAPAPDATRSAEEDDEDEDEDDEEERKKRAAETPVTEPSSAPETTNPEPTERNQPMSAAADTTTAGPDLAAARTARNESLFSIRNMNPAHYPEADLQRDLNSEEGVNVIAKRVADKVIAAHQGGDVRSASDQVFSRMSDKEKKSYSLRNAIVATINQRQANTFKDKGAEAGFEREVSDDLAKTLGERGIPASGNILVPSDLGRRSLQVGGNAGATTINTETRGEIIDMLRARCRVLALGATQITMDTGLLRLPRQTGTATSQWLAELAGGTNSDATLDTISFSPKRNGIVGSYTLELLAQSAINVEGFIRADQLASKARTYDAVMIAGTGAAGMPLGLLNMTGLAMILTGATRGNDGTVTAGAGGKPVSFIDLNNFEAAIANVNGDTGTMGWLYTPRVRAAMRGTAKFPGTGGFMPILPDSATGADGLQDGPLGYKAGVTTNGLPTNGTANSVNNLHTMILGVWSNLIVANWGVSELVYDNITGAKQGLFQIIENEFMDVNCTHIEGFAASTTVLPS